MDNDPEKYEPDAMDVTPERLLDEALRDVRDPNYFQDEDGKPCGPPDKAFLILLWDSDKNYGNRYRNSGMKLSEIVSLLEIVKQRLVLAIIDPENDDAIDGE